MNRIAERKVMEEAHCIDISNDAYWKGDSPYQVRISLSPSLLSCIWKESEVLALVPIMILPIAVRQTPPTLINLVLYSTGGPQLFQWSPQLTPYQSKFVRLILVDLLKVQGCENSFSCLNTSTCMNSIEFSSTDNWLRTSDQPYDDKSFGSPTCREHSRIFLPKLTTVTQLHYIDM